MRGAIAEVEDYARVSVATRSQAALAGSAVADVIHLLAELIENATTLSPPYTSVRVSGDTVANGFVIEVEDRGLGMSPTRMAELNDRLANPPEFNPSDSEQLGLFVVSQLAKRHGIRVTLKASPYGGTAAIVLVPRHLVVTEEAFRTGLPGEPAMAQLTANGNHAVPSISSMPAIPGRAGRPGIRLRVHRARRHARARPGAGGAHLRAAAPLPGERPGPGRNAARTPRPGPPSARRNGSAGHEPDELPRRHHDQPGTPGGPAQSAGGAGRCRSGHASVLSTCSDRRGQPEARTTPGRARPPSGNGAYIAVACWSAACSSRFAGPADALRDRRRRPDPDQPAPFPGWTLHNTPGAPGGAARGRHRAGPRGPRGPRGRRGRPPR